VLKSLGSFESVWNIEPKGVLHVGAHLAEESDECSRYKWGWQKSIFSKPEWMKEQTPSVFTLLKALSNTQK